MPTSRLPAPGTEFGPCAEPCEHSDCAATRALAVSECRLCGNAIGYEERYYTDPEDRAAIVHGLCLERVYEAERKNS